MPAATAGTPASSIASCTAIDSTGCELTSTNARCSAASNSFTASANRTRPRRLRNQ
ncbi:hypothetical protein SAZ_40855 [Streptomyces noursei ZPM]|nr:hypothetical protein SAZ_40855 [Streptomyces noursei ZPM]